MTQTSLTVQQQACIRNANAGGNNLEDHAEPSGQTIPSQNKRKQLNRHNKLLNHNILNKKLNNEKDSIPSISNSFFMEEDGVPIKPTSCKHKRTKYSSFCLRQDNQARSLYSRVITYYASPVSAKRDTTPNQSTLSNSSSLRKDTPSETFKSFVSLRGDNLLESSLSLREDTPSETFMSLRGDDLSEPSKPSQISKASGRPDHKSVFAPYSRVFARKG